MTKPLPWASLRVFVELLLFWRGDTADAPLVSSNPEGSDASPGQDKSWVVSDRGRTNDKMIEPPVVGGHAGAQAGIVVGDKCAPLLWNNQYAALMDLNEG